jgi:hypothetical protein
MSSSAHTSRRLGTSIACALAAALIAVPLASASGSQRTITENSATQNRVDRQNSYNQLDPWLDRLLHKTAASTSATGSAIRLITENSATQNRVGLQNSYNQLDPWLARLLHRTAASTSATGSTNRLITENSAGQNRPDQQGTYGQLNPWLHHMLHEANAYSASSGPVESRVATSDTRPSGSVVASASRFPGRDIAIGAAGTLAVALLAAGALFAVRRTRGRFAPVS